MRDPEEIEIPGASVGYVDLDTLEESVASELKELSDIVYRGEETSNQFLRLCELLFDIGKISESELLLRRGVNFYNGSELYLRLFGTKTSDTFLEAICSFQSQFDVVLKNKTDTDFLISEYKSFGSRGHSGPLCLLNGPFSVKFTYIDLDKIDARVNSHNPKDYYYPEVFFLYLDGEWVVDDD